MNERDIFIAAIQKEGAAERQAYLDEACGADAVLRQQVESLLQVCAKVGGFLDSPPRGLEGTIDEPIRDERGTVIGPYKLLQQIGEGGMGTVFVAEQTRPLQRKVALKLIKSGMESRQVIARFEAERQALALMDHPNIARVLDAGTTGENQDSGGRNQSSGLTPDPCLLTPGEGRPYFVMELVKGVPITKYCDQEQLSLQERLALFIPVCQAIQHAHQKGIIHRDLKPSNVLIGLYDGRPVPKVIDFGVAKATGQRLSEHSVFTGLGTMIGTLEYMAPEQAELNNLDIDTRADIYSLGVLLYELLTGSPPFTAQQLRSVAFAEMLRLIREVEPSKPSTKLSGSDELPAIAARRKLEPRKLTRLVSGDLDWIVMKCLEKDRGRRYESANGLAQDLERFLADEPVLAGRPSASYRLRKFVSRNRGAVLAGTMILVCLLLAGGTGLWLWQAGVERRAAEAARQERLLLGVEEALGEVRQLQGQARWPEARAALAQTAARLGPEGTDDMLRRLDQARRDLDLVARLDDIRLQRATWVEGGFDNAGADRDYARAFAEAELGQEGDDTQAVAERVRASAVRGPLVAALDDWAAVQGSNAARRNWLLTTARLVDPDAWRDRARDPAVWRDGAALERLTGEEEALGQSPQLVAALATRMTSLGRDATGLLRGAQAVHPGDFWLNFRLASVLLPSNADDAVAYCRVALALRPGTPAVLNNLGNYLAKVGKLEEAKAAYDKAIALDPQFAMPHHNLGNLLCDQGKLEEAEAAYRKAIALDPQYAAAHNGLGLLLVKKGKLEDAEAAYRKAIALDPQFAMPHSNLGLLLADHRKLEDAEAAYRKAIALDPKLASSHYNLGLVLHKKGKLEEAEREYQQAIALDPKHAEGHNGLGIILHDRQQWDEAIVEFRTVIQIDPKGATGHLNLANALRGKGKLDEASIEYHEVMALDPKDALLYSNLGDLLRDQGKPEEAGAAYRKAIALDPKLASPHHNLGFLLHNKGKLEEAEREYQQAITLDPKHTSSHNNLGSMLQEQGKREEAEAAYRKAIALDPKFAMPHFSLGRLLYNKGKLEEAEREYRAVLELRPDFAEAHCNLGQILQRQGRLTESLAIYRRGHDLGSKQPGWRYPSARWVKEGERLIELDAKLSAILNGSAKPANARERLDFARLCQNFKGLFAASARLYAEAFAAEPKLADDPRRPNRYNAACVAALAGCGQGKDAQQSDDKERGRLRRQALDCLRADLEAWGRLLKTEPSQTRPVVVQQMRHWLADTDFAGVRGPDALAKLAQEERRAWEQLWANVAETLAKAEGKPASKKAPDTK